MGEEGDGEGMTRQEEIDHEVRIYAMNLLPKCRALFQLPNMVYAEIVKDNTMRKKPIRASYERIKRIIHGMAL